MKANESQIGGWRQHANCKYYQVTRIDSLGDGNIHFACGFPHLWEYNNKFEPIQLEKIHLDKNGFEVRDGTDDMEFFYNEGYEVKVMFDEGCVIYEQDGKTIFDEIPPSIFLVIEFAEKSLQMPIEYVHELQQAMRIIGCDKEIEL